MPSRSLYPIPLYHPVLFNLFLYTIPSSLPYSFITSRPFNPIPLYPPVLFTIFLYNIPSFLTYSFILSRPIYSFLSPYRPLYSYLYPNRPIYSFLSPPPSSLLIPFSLLFPFIIPFSLPSSLPSFHVCDLFIFLNNPNLVKSCKEN